MPKFKKKPVIIEAVRVSQRLTIETLEGDMVAEPGAWLITGVHGEQYPCRDDIFRETYEPADDAAKAAMEMDGPKGRGAKP